MTEGMMIALIAIGVLQLALIVVLVVLIARLSSRKKPARPENTAGEVKVVDGVRYSESSDITAVTHNEGDFILKKGEAVAAKKGGELMPGKYTVLSAGGERRFNLRFGGVVREFAHGDEIVLADGDEITAVSQNVILR